ncbi:hypothetical protein [Helicobacter pylori]|nr:hypothetical protein [Helicobacter pylori]
MNFVFFHRFVGMSKKLALRPIKGLGILELEENKNQLTIISKTDSIEI